MGRKPFTVLSAILFAIVASAHLVRIVQGWEILVDGVSIPMWVSIVGMVVPGGLAIMLLKESKGS
jgi:hypothetical protein